MGAVSKVMFQIETPWEHTQTRSMVKAMEWVEDCTINQGHLDGFYVTMTLDVVEGELPDDTDWLEKRLGRQGDEEG